MNHYTYRAVWSPEDDEYVGLCAEFPSLSWLAPTAGEATAGIERLVDDVVADMVANGETVPTPLTERRYSGKLMVRTSPDLHFRLTLEAAEQGVSVNQLAVQRLSERPRFEGRIAEALFHQLSERWSSRPTENEPWTARRVILKKGAGNELSIVLADEDTADVE